MLVATAAALVWVNADASSYHRVWDTVLSVRIGGSGISENLRYWQEEWPRREKQWRRIQSLYDAAAGKAGSALARIRARQSLLDLRLAYLASVTEHLLARARLERAVGREIAP